MLKSLGSVVMLLWWLVTLPMGCLGDGDEIVEPDGDQCINPGGLALRCAELVAGDCEESTYLQWRGLAPVDGEWRLAPESCGEHEGSWVGSQQLGALIFIHRVTVVEENERFEDWLVQLFYEGELCFQRYRVVYVDPDVGCEGGLTVWET